MGLQMEHSGQPQYAYGDPDQIEMVFSALLSNAIKYSPDGGTVILGARIGNGYAVIWVGDEGMGIPPEDLDEIFDRFFRIDTMDEKRTRATGLGLPLVKEIAKAHGGRVWVESSFGKGSTFFLTIPLDTSARVFNTQKD